MRYKIVIDDNINIPEEFKNDSRFEKVTANKNFQYPTDYVKAYEDDADMIIVLASKDGVGDCYNVAVAGRRLYIDSLKRQGLPKKKIFIMDYDATMAKTEDIFGLAYKSCEKGLAFGDTCLDLMFSYNKIKMVSNLAQFTSLCPASV